MAPLDTSKRGTGDELGRIDLGRLGTIIIRDDGDPDECITNRCADDPDKFRSVYDAVYEARQELGDDVIMEELSKLAFDPPTPEPSMKRPPLPRYTAGPFQCHECGLTWPEKRNKTPELGEPDTCPECYEDMMES